MGYPVAYRSGARKYQSGGFQNPLTVPPGRYGKPANDNWPRPDNDNVPGAGRPPLVKPPKDSTNPWPGFGADVADEALRRLIPPQYRIILDAAELGYSLMSADKTKMPTVRLENGLKKQCGYSTPPAGYVGSYRWHFGNFTNLCGYGGQALGDGAADPPMYAGDRYGNYGPFIAKNQSDRLSGSAQRSFIVAKFHKWRDPANAPAFQIQWDFPMKITGPLAPYELPAPLPAVVENPLPAMVPAPQGYAVPRATPMPATVPSPRSQPWAYVRPPSALPGRLPGFDPANEGKPVVVVNPGVVTNPVRRPPGPGVKERKVRAQGSLAVFNNLLGGAAKVYEDAKFYDDVLNAWYNALPGKKTARNPIEKGMELYRRYDEIDVQKAIIGVLIAVAGEKAGAYLDRARRVTGDNLGVHMYIQIPTGSAPRI